MFSRITRILQDFELADERCERTLTLVLTFAEKNPGMCRLLSGDALAGETERLRQRIQQFFERIETQLKQILREAEMREKKVPVQNRQRGSKLAHGRHRRANSPIRAQRVQRASNSVLERAMGSIEPNVTA